MKVGIVGHEQAKFNKITEAAARNLIHDNIIYPGDTIISGGCHLGGIDIYAEEIAKELGNEMIVHLPKKQSWLGGYKDRNLKIARESDIVHVIVVEKYPEGYDSMKFNYCYHCGKNDHIKSGGCWTAKKAKIGVRHIIHIDGSVTSEPF